MPNMTPANKKQSPKSSLDSISPASSRKTSPSSLRKASPFILKKSPRRAGLHAHAFKSKGLNASKKNQIESNNTLGHASGGFKKLKPRLFFIEKSDLTDDEVLNNIGRENMTKTGFEDLERVISKTEKNSNNDKKKIGNVLKVPPPIFHT